MSVTVSVLYAEEYGKNFPPNNLLDFKLWVDELIEGIPKEHRATAEINIESQESYDSFRVEIDVSYRRQNTKAELKEIEAQRTEFDALALKKKRELLEKLKIELGGEVKKHTVQMRDIMCKFGLGFLAEEGNIDNIDVIVVKGFDEENKAHLARAKTLVREELIMVERRGYSPETVRLPEFIFEPVSKEKEQK